MAGKTLQELGYTKEVVPTHMSVKESVFPFIKFPGVDVLLGPEMKSTGEVMGIDSEFGPAYLKSQYSTEYPIPRAGTAFISVAGTYEKKQAAIVARRLRECGFSLAGTEGTAEALGTGGIECAIVGKVHEANEQDVTDLIARGQICMVINIPGTQKESIQDSFAIRLAALNHNVPYFTTLAGANAFSLGLRALLRGDSFGVMSLQEYHGTNA
jgi:carbamoyl-phosphate synthase large subunit